MPSLTDLQEYQHNQSVSAFLPFSSTTKTAAALYKKFPARVNFTWHQFKHYCYKKYNLFKFNQIKTDCFLYLSGIALAVFLFH